MFALIRAFFLSTSLLPHVNEIGWLNFLLADLNHCYSDQLTMFAFH